MYKKLLGILIGFCVINSLSAQSSYVTYDDVNKKTKKCYDKGIQLSRKSVFKEANEHFDKALKKYPNFIDAHLQKASIYYESQDYKPAIESFKKVIALDPSYNHKVYYTLGMACFKYGDYTCAEHQLARYLDLDSTNNMLIKRAEATITSAKLAGQLIEERHEVKAYPLPPTINTEHSEYLPTFSLDGQTLIFTRRIAGDEDFYQSQRTDSTWWSDAQPITFINTGYNEGAQCLSADGKLLIFTGCGRRDGQGGCDLYYSFKKNGEWVKPKNMGSTINSPGWESQPSLSADARTLYFASNRSGGHGGNDIWISQKADEGYFDTPINLGQPINTSKDEFAPFIHADDQTLYFTSVGHPGLGKSDLFLSHRAMDGTWEYPINLGSPINSPAAEGGLVINMQGDTAYFARGQDSKGISMDIYAFNVPEALRPLPVTFVQAIVTDQSTGRPIHNATLILSDNQTGLEVSKQSTNLDGSFIIALPLGTDYAFRVERENYLFYSDRFNLDSIHDKADPFIYAIALVPVPKTETITMTETTLSTPIILNNIFFESNKYQLLENSMPELHILFQQMTSYPNMKIQIHGHTDNVGNEADNLLLSERRAKSVFQYLVQQGISESRLSYKGFGETQPIADNTTADGRKKNRRTAFIIIK